jgi:saccharopine dehydrogenase-like NADP-dependent oxidoreductase
VFTDLGLAPGLVNILAEQGYRELFGTGKIISVEMMVGGLPDYLESNRNPLRYALTWSTDGLINEYKDDCLVLRDGQVKLVGGMSGLERVETKSLGPLEAFYTSGGASHTIKSMKRKGVANCSYKTLRYKGHCNIVKFLIKDCDLDKEVLEKIFTSCGFAQKDEVIVLAKVHKDDKSWVKEKLVKSDDQFSAMQKATAFPISSVAALMAEGKLEGDYREHRDHYDQYPKSLSYEMVPFEGFHANLKKLNFNLDE